MRYNESVIDDLRYKCGSVVESLSADIVHGDGATDKRRPRARRRTVAASAPGGSHSRLARAASRAARGPRPPPPPLPRPLSLRRTLR